MDGDYPFIRLWGWYLGSFDYYVETQIKKAREDKAPPRSIYYSEGHGKWFTVDDISNLRVRRVLLDKAKEIQCS